MCDKVSANFSKEEESLIFHEIQKETIQPRCNRTFTRMHFKSNEKLFGGRFPQILAVIAATVGAISDGMQYGWAAPVIPLLQKSDSPVPIGETEIIWIELLYMIGGLCGLPVTIYIVDKIGRKLSIITAGVANLTAWILVAVARNIPTLYVARFLTGMAGDVAFVAGPMYVAEIADKSIRGLLSGFIYIAMLIGIIVVYSVAPFVSIPISSGVGAIFIILQLSTFSFMPESPYFLLIEKKKSKARAALQFLRGSENVEGELNEIEAAVERQEKERGRPIDLIVDKGNRKATIIMTVLNGSQHLSSISVMLMNLHTILNDAAGILDSNTAGIVFSVIMFIFATGAIAVVDKFGRKKLLIFSSLMTGVSLAILATYFALKDAGRDVTTYSWVPIFAVFLYAAAFKCGLGIVPIVMTGELFPTSVKAMGMTVADAVYVIFGTISIYVYQVLVENFGLFCPFYLFSCCCLITAAFAMWYIPETNGKTLEEIQYILKGLDKPQQEQQMNNSKL